MPRLYPYAIVRRVNPSFHFPSPTTAMIACASLMLLYASNFAAARDVRHEDQAVPATPALPVTSSEPQQTSATFGDWIVRCERAATGKRMCEVAQSLAIKGQQNPIAKIAFGYPGDAILVGKTASEASPSITVLLPVNITFDRPARLSGSDDAGGVILNYRRCVPVGCVASGKTDAATIKDMRDMQKTGRLSFADASGRMLLLPVSFHGLGQALDNLVKEMSGNAPSR